MAAITSINTTFVAASRTAVRTQARARVVSVSAQSPKEYAATLPGITAPFGDGPWDPAGLLDGANSIKDVRRWREAELTHGRVSMLAALGFVVGEQLEDFPLFLNFDGNITGPAINQFQQVGQGFWEPLVLVIGILESYRVSLAWDTPTGASFNQVKDEYEIGELGFDPLNFLDGKSADEVLELKNRELNNGRLAMISIAGFVAQECVNNTEIFKHLFLDIEDDVLANPSAIVGL